MDKVFRIYTEDLNRQDVIRLASEQFDSFTLQPTVGYFRGKPENSIVLEIVESDENHVRELASRIRQLNGQKSALVITLQGRAQKVEG